MTRFASTLVLSLWLAGFAIAGHAAVPDAGRFAPESAVATVHCSGERFYRFWPLASWLQLEQQTQTAGAAADLKQKSRALYELKVKHVCGLEKRSLGVESTFIPEVGIVVDPVFWTGSRGAPLLDKARARLKPGQPAIQAYVEALNDLIGAQPAAVKPTPVATVPCVSAASAAEALNGPIKALQDELLAYYRGRDASVSAGIRYGVELEMMLVSRYPELKERVAELGRLSSRRFALTKLPKGQCVDAEANAGAATVQAQPVFGGAKAAQPLVDIGANLGLKGAAKPAPGQGQGRSAEAGLAAADRAATALGYPDDPAVSDTEMELMVDAALGGFDNLAAAQQALSAETARTQEAGDGSRLRILRLEAPEDRQHLPGDSIEIRVTVANDAAKGNPAYATLGLWDYGAEKDVDKRQLRIAPGGRDTQVFRWRVPGDFR